MRLHPKQKNKAILAWIAGRDLARNTKIKPEEAIKIFNKSKKIVQMFKNNKRIDKTIKMKDVIDFIDKNKKDNIAVIAFKSDKGFVTAISPTDVILTKDK